MADKNGVIYVLTNPSFPEYVKIGYADDIQTRLKQLTGIRGFTVADFAGRKLTCHNIFTYRY